MSREFLNSIKIEDKWSMNIFKRLNRKSFYVRHPGFVPLRQFDHLTITRSEILNMYGPTILMDLQEESTNDEHILKKDSINNWRTRLKKVPVNGELYTRKMLRHRINIPADLQDLPGWKHPGNWDTVLVDISRRKIQANRQNISNQPLV